MPILQSTYKVWITHKWAYAIYKKCQAALPALCGNLPRIELFARRKVDGWDCWGNEVESDI